MKRDNEEGFFEAPSPQFQPPPMPPNRQLRKKADVNTERAELMLGYLAKLVVIKSSLGTFNGVKPGERIKSVCNAIEKELGIHREA